jgi:ligand-binding sensor domain-containing protein
MKTIQLFFVIMILAMFSCGQTETSIIHTDPIGVSPDTLWKHAEDSVSLTGPTRMVRNIKQARNGEVLIAAYDGIRRYNGKTFTKITNDIQPASFWDVIEDKNGNLWLGSKDSGVYCFNGKYFTHYTTRHGLPSNMVMHLYEDKAGNIWMACGNGASCFDGQNFKHYTTQDGLPSNSINFFMEDKAGKIWLGTRGDMYTFDGKTFHLFKNNQGESFYNVWAIIEDQKGYIWFGGSIIKEKVGSTLFQDNGLWRYDGKQITKVTEDLATAIIQDKDGNIWTSHPDGPNGRQGWSIIRYDNATLYEEKPTATEIYSTKQMLCRLLQTKDGSIWFGSGQGVYRYDGKEVGHK